MSNSGLCFLFSLFSKISLRRSRALLPHCCRGDARDPVTPRDGDKARVHQGSAARAVGAGAVPGMPRQRGDPSRGTLPPDQLPKERVQQGEYEVHHHEAIQVLPHACLPALGRQAKLPSSMQQGLSSPMAFLWPPWSAWGCGTFSCPTPLSPGTPCLGCPCLAVTPSPRQGADGACGAVRQTPCCQTPDPAGAGTAALALAHTPWARDGPDGTAQAAHVDAMCSSHGSAQSPVLHGSTDLCRADDSPSEPLVAEQAKDHHLQNEIPAEQEWGREPLSPGNRGAEPHGQGARPKASPHTAGLSPQPAYLQIAT